MSYLYPRQRREIPTAYEMDVLAAVEGIATLFEDAAIEVDGRRETAAKAVQIYLMKASLSWSFSRITRRLGDDWSLQYAMRLYPRGKRLVEAAVQSGKITPAMVARLLPSQVYI